MRRHINIESDIAETSATAELQKTFALLLPIRRQRLSRSERLQREQERVLREADQRIVSAQQQLEVRQNEYQQVRANFRAGRQQQSKLVRRLDNEREAGEAVQGQSHQLDTSVQYKAEQQQRLAEAQQETLLRQRELEKLEYLISENEGLQ